MRRVLVVAPLNTLLNWQVEFEKWLAVDDRLEVLEASNVICGFCAIYCLQLYFTILSGCYK